MRAANLVISRFYNIFAVTPFQASHVEMGSRNLLKVVDECVIHRCAAERSDNWHSLSRKLLSDNETETGCDLCQ
jgi:hypothetical protein